MKVNVDKVLERDAKLSELDSRAGKLIYKYILEGFLFFICLCEWRSTSDSHQRQRKNSKKYNVYNL